jgi:alanine dehydrogenase
MVLLLDDVDVDGLVTMDDALQCTRQVLASHGRGRAQNVPRGAARLQGTALSILAGAWETTAVDEPDGQGWLAAKLSVRAGDTKTARTLLFDHEGAWRCLVSGNRLGQLRTAAATGVSVDLLARCSARVLACLGAGYQAWTQIEAVTRVREIERVLLWNRTFSRAGALARRVEKELGITAEVRDTPAAAVAEADIVVTVTAAAAPILRAVDVPEGAHVVLAGSNQSGRREADADLFAGAGAVYADDLTQARSVSGDLIMAVDEGALAWSDVRPLGAAVADAEEHPRAVPGIAGHQQDHDYTVFCSQGVGSWDVALAAVVYQRALARGVGSEVHLDISASRRPS